MEQTTKRLDKYLANVGVCSRRNVEELLRSKTVTINGKRVTAPGFRIDPEKDDIRLDGKRITAPKLVYYLLNKPRGIVSTASDEYGRTDVTTLIPATERIFPVGRLDKDTTGLLLLTNDGELANLLTHPRYQVHKVYRLKIKGTANSAQLRSLRNGVRLDDGKTSPEEVNVLKEGNAFSYLEITLHEGKNRQIRRMCEVVRINLLELSRIKFGPIEIGAVKEGEYRELTDKEVEGLRKSAVIK